MPDPILQYETPPRAPSVVRRPVGFHSLVAACTLFCVGFVGLVLAVSVKGEVGELGKVFLGITSALMCVVAPIAAAEVQFFERNVSDRRIALAGSLANLLGAVVLVCLWGLLK